MGKQLWLQQEMIRCFKILGQINNKCSEVLFMKALTVYEQHSWNKKDTLTGVSMRPVKTSRGSVDLCFSNFFLFNLNFLASKLR